MGVGPEPATMAAVATLVAGIANEFNNSLAAISGSLEAAELRMAAQGRRPPEELLDARAATRSASRLVRRLLNVVRPAPGTRQVLDPGRLVEEAAAVLRRDLDPRITLVTRLAHGDWRVAADLEQLTDLLVSLGTNALEAMPQGGVLTLATTRVPGEPGHDLVRFEVRDTGVGIPAEVLPRIFEAFFTTKESGRGPGLGLATAAAVLEQHDAQILVESTPGEGALFALHLPRTLDPVLAACPAPALLPGSGRILLVDDDAAVRRPLRQALALSGYTVIEAHDGLEALGLHARGDPPLDLVVLDVKMPGMSGWDVLGELKRRTPALPVILTSGYTRAESAPPADAARPEAYLPKPYNLAELTTLVRGLLDPVRAATRGAP